MEVIDQRTKEFGSKIQLHFSEYSDLIHNNMKDDVGPIKMLLLTFLLKFVLFGAKFTTYLIPLVHYLYVFVLFLSPTLIYLAQSFISHPFVNQIISYVMSFSLLIFSSFFDLFLLKKKFDMLEKKHNLLEKSHLSLQQSHNSLEKKVVDLSHETERLKEEVKEINEKHDLVCNSERRLTMEHTQLQEKHETLRHDFDDFKQFVIMQLKK